MIEASAGRHAGNIDRQHIVAVGRRRDDRERDRAALITGGARCRAGKIRRLQNVDEDSLARLGRRAGSVRDVCGDRVIAVGKPLQIASRHIHGPGAIGGNRRIGLEDRIAAVEDPDRDGLAVGLGLAAADREARRCLRPVHQIVAGNRRVDRNRRQIEGRRAEHELRTETRPELVMRSKLKSTTRPAALANVPRSRALFVKKFCAVATSVNVWLTTVVPRRR